MNRKSPFQKAWPWMLIIGGALFILVILPFVLIPGISAVQKNEENNNSLKMVVFEETADTRILPIFEDTFDEGLVKWQRYGYPFPEVRSDMGNPPPSFDSRGDDLYDSYALSYARFNYTDGRIMPVPGTGIQ